MKSVKLIDWGLIDYQIAWDNQKELFEELVDQKKMIRTGVLDVKHIPHKLVFCEHKHVYTLGKSGKVDHLLMSANDLEENDVKFYKINRGGDITYHGPGQLVAYPIFDLDEFFNDVHRYVRNLEEVVIRVLSDYGIEGSREEGFTGVWILDKQSGQVKKICAIGVHLSRWISMHGLAFNINNDLAYFNGIIPCGIQEAQKEVTSLSLELGYNVEIADVKEKLKMYFKQVFKFEFIK